MIFEKMIRSGGKFIEKNASTILSVFASVGVGTTAFLAGKAACESVRYYDQNSGWTHDGCVEVPSKKEVFQATWRSYIPAAISGGITIACVLSANALSKKQQASLMAAYMLLLNRYNQYKSSANVVFGEGSDEKIQEQAMRENDMHPFERSVSNGNCLFYEEHYGEIFERTMLEVLSAELEMNRRFITNGEVPLNDFYDLLALDHRMETEDLGWGQEDVFDANQSCWLNFSHDLAKTDDGMEVYIINVDVDPTPNYSQIPPWFDK